MVSQTHCIPETMKNSGSYSWEVDLGWLSQAQRDGNAPGPVFALQVNKDSWDSPDYFTSRAFNISNQASNQPGSGPSTTVTATSATGVLSISTSASTEQAATMITMTLTSTPSGSPSSFTTSSPDSHAVFGGLGPEARLGLGVGLGIGIPLALAIAAFITWLVRSRRKRQGVEEPIREQGAPFGETAYPDDKVLDEEKVRERPISDGPEEYDGPSVFQEMPANQNPPAELPTGYLPHELSPIDHSHELP